MFIPGRRRIVSPATFYAQETAVESIEEIVRHLQGEVYVRIRDSDHGVGVFAIRDIPEGIDPFFEDTIGLRFVYVPEGFIMDDPCIPEGIKKLVHDMCSVRNGFISFPVCGLNGITAGFYMNHSKNPNVEITGNPPTTWRTLRPIAEGEELTTNYTTYDERCDDVT